MKQLMIQKTAMLLSAIFATVLVAAAQAQSDHVKKSAPNASPTGYWIVQLDDAPSVRFEGDVVESITTDGSRVAKALEATAPEVTGAVKMDVQAPAVQRYVAHLDDERAQFLRQAEQQMGRTLLPRHVYRHVLNGFAIQLSDAEAQQLAQMPGVKSVEPDELFELQTDAGPDWIGATRFWAGAGGVPNPNFGEGMVLGVVDTGINWESVFLDAQSSGNSPVSNPRPAQLGLCSDPEVPCSGKLIGVYDFTDEDTNGKDPDGHGSHVSTTALGYPFNFSLSFLGGSPINFQTSGVAPRASLISYKACEENPDGGNFTCPNSATLAALEQAITNQVDAVNYSIGGPPFNPWAGQNSASKTTPEVFLNLRAAGIVPVVAAGNSGPSDGSLSSPANAPWVFAAANGTHNRILANQLTSTAGGASPIGTLIGLGQTEGTNVLPIVHASDFGNALCGTGTAELGPTCGSNTGATNPFAPGTFNGQIVVCDRGVYGRIEKGKNVQAAGAAGMILANTQAQGESIISDEHCLPATHVGAQDGDRLRDWLDSGSNHRGRLTGISRVIDPGSGGRINQSSGRGPAVGAENVMKPNAVAPGTDVLAASFSGPNSISFLTGTSMASPHVAGAALLLRKSHPSWGVDEVISALETTADPDIVRLADDSPARIVDRGAGGIQVDRAARIGLYLPTTIQQFRSANPGLGGDPSELNLPGMVSNNCLGECTFTRRVRALGSSTWTVTAEGDLDIQATPSSFTLSAGQEQVITVRVQPGSAEIGDWGAGSVVLSSSNNQFVTQRLPVGAFVSGGILPDSLSYTSESNRGRGTLEIQDAEPYSEAVYRTSALQRPTERSVDLREDPTPTQAFDSATGVYVEFIDVPADSLLLYAETFTSASLDVDLYIGRDTNENNQADESEVVCESLGQIDLEQCSINTPAEGRWWILVQNFDASTPVATDAVPFEYALFSDDDDPSLVVSGPANTAGGDLELPVYWIQPEMRRNERWVGAVGIASSPDSVANVGVVPITVTRTGTNAPMITPLFEGRNETIVIAANTTHDQIFIDVPNGASSINVSAVGELTDLTIAAIAYAQVDGLAQSYSEIENPTPPLQPGPGGPVSSTVVEATGNGFSATVEALSPEFFGGRYYIILENERPSETLVQLQVEVEEPVRIDAQRGLWSPRDRGEIFQGFQWDIGGGNAFVVWYTYDEDGINTFYLSNATEIDPSSSYLTLPIYRYTSNRTRQTPDRVGDVQITLLSQFDMSYAWKLNGTRNAELQVAAHGSDCPTIDGQTQPLLGMWFTDGVTEGGASVLMTSFAEAWVRYYFDNSGQPRWVYADAGGPATSLATRRLSVNEFQGACIYCEDAEVTFESVGFLERSFDGLISGTERLQFESRPPLNESYSTDRPLGRLSSIPVCSN